MQILFENGVQVQIQLTNSPAQDTILNIYKHLQHVPVTFRPWDSSLYRETHTFDEILEKLIEYGSQVGVTIELNNLKQSYWNHLHQLYEENYDGRPEWLAFHEHIHLCEGYYIHQPHNTLAIDYREKSGLLERSFDRAWMTSATTKLKAGDVYLRWAELGKTPYDYYQDNEPETIDRLCNLAKPWLILKPRLMITLVDTDRMSNIDIDGFNKWWPTYEKEWCQYYNIPNWSVEEQHSVVVIGNIHPVDTVVNLLKTQIYPVKVQL